MAIKTYWRVTYGKYNHSFVFDDEGEATSELQMLQSEGEDCKLEAIEMDESDFEAMPEFEGF